MSESAPSRPSEIAAADAVKAYIRMNRARLSADGELLALLLPERFPKGEVSDLQRYTIERLKAENLALRLERDALKGTRERGLKLSEGVRRAVLELLDARTFSGIVSAATGAAAAFGADRAVICIESGETSASFEEVRLIAPGTVAAVVGPEGMGAILSGGGEYLFGCPGFRSLAAFRLHLGRLQALYVLGAEAEGRFEDAESEAGLGYFARALERAISSWLDLPRS